MTETKTVVSFNEILNKFPNTSVDLLFSIAKTLGVDLSVDEMLKFGMRFDYVKRGRGAFQQRIVIPDIKLGDENITGAVINPKLARATAKALLDFCDKNNL